MDKQAFLAQLRRGLSGLPREDIDDRVMFYAEMIDDRVEEGLSEPDAVSQLGTVEAVVDQILAETPLTKLVKEKVRPNRALRVWEIVLLVLGSPVWLSLLIAAAAVVLAVYVVIWSVIVVLWSVELSVAAGALGGVLTALLFAVRGQGFTAVAMLGAGLLCAGLTIFLFAGCKAATKATLRLTGKMALGVKSMFVGKECAQ